MHGLGILPLLRKIVRQGTVEIGENVSNLHGAVAGTAPSMQPDAHASWWHLRVPGSILPTLDDFYATYSSQPARYSETLHAVSGIVLVSPIPRVPVDNTPSVHLLRGALATTASLQLPLAVDVGGPQGAFAVYVDGKLERRGVDAGAVVVSLDAGTHTIEVLALATTLAVSVPPSAAVSVLDDFVQPPVFAAVETGYLDPTTPSVMNRLTWFNDTRAGGWIVYRREFTDVGTALDVYSLDRDGVYSVDLAGDLELALHQGEQVYAGSEPMGTVVSAQHNTDLDQTIVRIRIPEGYDTLPSHWTGSTVSTGQLIEITRIRRNTAQPTLTWTDVNVVLGGLYQYTLQAHALQDPNLVSGYADMQWVRAGDTEPPASIAFLASYPTAVNKRVIVRFHTPVDSDYAGVRVYRRESYAGTTNGGTGNTTLLGTSVPAGVVAGWTIRLLNGTADEQERVIASTGEGGVITHAGDPWYVDPGVGTNGWLLFKDTPILTDFGLPDTDDELTFAADEEATYYFRTFDHAGNEQADIDAETYQYLTANDVFLGANQPPTVGIEQLNNTEQAGFGSYADSGRFCIVEISAADPVDGTTGVTLHYKTRDGSYAMPASTAAVAGAIDQPAGTRSRYVMLERQVADNWIVVWAVDTTGLVSSRMSFNMDADDTPELSALETRIDHGANKVYATGVVDDDTCSIAWWLEPSTGTLLEPGEPSATAKNTTSDLRDVKTFAMEFVLKDGQRKTLKIQPYSWINATGTFGPAVAREFARSPRTEVHLESKDSLGNVSGGRMRADFKVVPALDTPVETLTAHASLGSTTSIQLPSNALDTNEYAYSVGLQKFYFVETADGQVRRITHNSLNVINVTPAWDTIPYSQSLNIWGGATLYRLDGEAEFTPVINTPIFFDRNTGRTIEYYSVRSGVAAEPVRKTSVDKDTVPYIDALAASESTANVLTATLSGLDDDVKYWRLYARKGGSWPTLTGNAPVLDSNGQWNVDETYLRWEDTPVRMEVSFFAGTGTWKLVAVPYNSYNEEGAVRTAEMEVVGPSAPGLSNARVEAASTTANRVIWDHNSTIGEAATDYTVKVYAYREDLGSGTETELTTGVTRNATFDSESGADPLLNTDDSNSGSYPSRGSWVHALSQTRGTSSNGTLRTWKYRVVLHDTGTPVATYTTEHSDYYKAAVSEVTSASAVITSGGTADGAACASPHVNTVTWAVDNVNDLEYAITVRYANTSGAPGSSDWMTLAAGLPTSATSYRHEEDGFYAAAGQTSYWWYQVFAVRKVDGVEGTKFTSSQLSQALVACLVG